MIYHYLLPVGLQPQTKKLLPFILLALVFSYSTPLVAQDPGLPQRKDPVRVGTVNTLVRHTGDLAQNPPFPQTWQYGDLIEGAITVNKYLQQPNGTQWLLGNLKDQPEANFFLIISPESAHGLLTKWDEREAIRFFSDESGEVYKEVLPLKEVLCVDYTPFVLTTPAQENAANEEELPAEANSSAFTLESLPGAEAVIYIDLDGETVVNSPWASGATINAASPQLGETTINNIWKRVSEDYLPFNINVTTNLAIYQAAPENRRIRCIVTPTDDWFGRQAGGVAYINSFVWTGDTPCWVFLDGVGTGDKNIGEAVSHEVGHTFGLVHDGVLDPLSEYYKGHGSGPTGWAPIMGVSYDYNLTHWAKGEYNKANNKQDDIAIISGTDNGFGFRQDDHSNQTEQATDLVPNQDKQVFINGLIEKASDVDVFTFKVVEGGSLNLNISPAVLGPNLDVKATLKNEGNATVSQSNPLDELGASLTGNLPAGRYFLMIEGSGKGDPAGEGYSDYGSIGAYTIAGTLNGAVGNQEAQSITFAALADKVTTDAPFDLQAIASSGLPVSFTLVSGPASIIGNTLTLSGATGTVTVRATQAGNASFLAAEPVERSFAVTKAPQTLNFPNIPDKPIDAAPFDVTATASSGLAVSLSVESGPATLSGNTLTLTGQVGNVTLKASQAGNETYQAVSATQTFSVGKKSQAITFAVIPNKSTADDPFELSAEASSGLPVNFQVLSGPASVNGTLLTLDGLPGEVTIRAAQPGNEEYAPADPVDRTFEVRKSGQGIEFGKLADKFPTDPPFEIAAEASSGLPVSFSLVSGPATLNGNTVTLTGELGTVTLRAEQAGNDAYLAATPVEQSFQVLDPDQVTQKSQSIDFPALSNRTTTAPPYRVSATATSGLAVSFRIVSGPATLSGNMITLEGNTGTVVVEASQNGDASYLAAAPVQQSFQVIKTPQTIRFPEFSSTFVDGPPITLKATASSGLPVSYRLISGPATLNGDVVTLKGTIGVVEIEAYQDGNDQYEPAAAVRKSFKIVGKPQTLSYDPIPDKATNDPPFELKVTASSGLPVELFLTQGPAQLNNNTITLNGNSGTVVIKAIQNGNDTYARVEESITFGVGKQSQTITLEPIPDKKANDPSFEVNATATSGLPVIVNILSGPASYNGEKIFLKGTPGRVIIYANQKGNADFFPAPEVRDTFYVGKKEQVITFQELLDMRSTDPSFDLAPYAKSSSGLTIKFQIVSGPAEISGSRLSLTGGPGTVVVRAIQTGNDEYDPAAPVERSFEVIELLGTKEQRILFPTIPDKLTTDAPFNVTVSATSGLAVKLSLVEGPAKIEGNQVTLEGTSGVVRIRASQTGDDEYKAATSLVQAFRVLKAPQVITLNDIPDKLTTDPPFKVIAVSTSDGPISLAVVSGPATLQGDTLTLTGQPGEVIIRATQAGNATYLDAEPNTTQFLVKSSQGGTLSQTIDFPALEDKLTTDPPMILEGIASSSLPVSYTVISGPAVMKGDTLILNRTAGEVVVEATQLGDESYEPAPPVQRSFQVKRAPQTIVFDEISDKSTQNKPFEVAPYSSSGLPVILELISGPATFEGNVLVLTGQTGTVEVRASQPGNETYQAAASITRSFEVINTQGTLAQDILFEPIPNKQVSDPPFKLVVAASSGLPVELKIAAGPATLKGDTVILDGIEGEVRIIANQIGNETFQPAPQVERSFTVGRLNQEIDFTPISDKLTTDQPFNLIASASSGLPVAFSLVSGPAVLNGNSLSLTGNTGTVTVEATQSGNEQYKPAPPVRRTFEVKENEGGEPCELLPSASSHPTTQPPSLSLDGDLNTYWEALSEKAWLQVALCRPQWITAIALAFPNGNQTWYSFNIQVSEDGIAWKTILVANSLQTANELEYFDLPDTYGKFVRIETIGNSQNMPAQISEVRLTLNPAFIYLEPVADAFVQGGAKSDKNYGKERQLITKRSDQVQYSRNTYLRFDLSGLVGIDLKIVKLRLTPRSVGEDRNAIRTDLFLAAQDDWEETEITWNTQLTAGEKLGSEQMPGNVAIVEFDITQAVRRELAQDQQLSLQLTSGLTGARNWVVFHSREARAHNIRPVLVINDTATAQIPLQFVDDFDDIDFEETGAPEPFRFTVYPVPSLDFVTIEGPVNQESVEGELILSNMLGQPVYRESLTISDGYLRRRINISKLEKGIYLIKVLLGDHVQGIRIQKQ